MQASVDFKSLNAKLLANIQSFLHDLYPNGKIVGKQFLIGDIYGAEGKSFSICLNRGIGKDFSSNEKGYADLISIFAAKNSISQLDAANLLIEKYGHAKINQETIKQKLKNQKIDLIIVPPPKGVRYPTHFFDKTIGSDAEDVYTYRSQDGKILFFILKYITKDLEKIFHPLCYSNLKKKWVKQSWPKLKPLYQIHRLKEYSSESWVVVVEGEKCVNASENVLVDERALTVTWAGGANAVEKSDWSPLIGRKILIWPDNDEVGFLAAEKIKNKLLSACHLIKILEFKDRPVGWDIADALNEKLFFSLKDFKLTTSKYEENTEII